MIRQCSSSKGYGIFTRPAGRRMCLNATVFNARRAPTSISIRRHLFDSVPDERNIRRAAINRLSAASMSVGYHAVEQKRYPVYWHAMVLQHRTRWPIHGMRAK